MTVLSFQELEDYWIQAGGSPTLAPEMAAIAEAESSGRSDALNDNPGTGDYSVGPWQINYYGTLLQSRTQRYGPPELLRSNPLFDAKAAVDLAAGGKGLHNWSTWTHGDYLKYMPPGATNIKPSSSGGFNFSGGLFNPGNWPDAVAGLFGGKNNPVSNAPQNLFNAVTDPIAQALLRGAMMIGGLLLLLLGLYLLARAFGATPKIPALALAEGYAGGRAAASSGPRRQGDAAAVRGEPVVQGGKPEPVTLGDRRRMARNQTDRERAERKTRKARDAQYGEIPF